MHLFHFDFPVNTPAEHLACDEALLELAEGTSLPGFLRFWESAHYFVVLGYGKKREEEVHQDYCAGAGVPVLRRCSGGGTVLQGPGCFNYSLVLPLDASSELETISGTNRFIMKRVSSAIARATNKNVEIRGFTDLTIDGRKFAGNAQRRKKRCLLFHGSLLLNFDLAEIEKTLRMPRQQPEYRLNREHGDFVTNLLVESEPIQKVLMDEWDAQEGTSKEQAAEIRTLTLELKMDKYDREEWNTRF